jgi:hypothetical protein
MHLHRYVSEFDYRYNTREPEYGKRTIQAIRVAEGKVTRHLTSANDAPSSMTRSRPTWVGE